ncbi:MAG: hypothetical protein JXN64_14470 [Spirochaetes bacterium]|nr:hypothetical protein [Spirochaetota bacterium]
MDPKIIDVLYNTADDFGKIAKKVNESSRKRKSYSEEAIGYLNMCIEIEEALNKDIDYFFDANIKQRDQDTFVFNMCKILKSNIDNQKKILKDIQKKNFLSKETYEQLSLKIKDFSQTLEEALSTIQRIIEKDNQIILMDKIIKRRKQLQRDSILMLKELTDTSLKDSERAIQGSSANLARGLKMVEKVKNTEKYVNEKNIQELNNIINEANKGWNTAAEVNKSSSSQFEFAEKVNKFTQQLYEDSVAIKDMIVHKHHEFEENLQMVTVLTVILSIKFKKYLPVEEVVDSIMPGDDVRELMLNLTEYIKIACQDIREVTALNYDMTDSSNLNNVVEDKAVKLTKEEIEHFDNIKKEVELMTEATRYPVEGSGKNILNGQVLEKNLKEILDSIQ